MPRIVEYTAPKDTITPSDAGSSAYSQAGRRIGPAYNEAATLLRQGAGDITKGAKDQSAAAELGVRAGEAVAQAGELGVRAAQLQSQTGRLEEQATIFSADQQDKLQKAMLSQYKDLFDIGLAGAKAAPKGGGGGGGFNVRDGSGSGKGRAGSGGGGGGRGYGPATEISSGAAGLTSKLARGDTSLSDYITKSDDRYNKIADGGTGTPQELDWFLKQQSANTAQYDKARQALVDQNYTEDAGQKAAAVAGSQADKEAIAGGNTFESENFDALPAPSPAPAANWSNYLPSFSSAQVSAGEGFPSSGDSVSAEGGL